MQLLISCPAVFLPTNSVNEVIQKIVSQESTTENLIAVTRENQGKIEALNQLRKQIKTHCEDIKYSGMCCVQRAATVVLVGPEVSLYGAVLGRCAYM
jgi:hypothetical protein